MTPFQLGQLCDALDGAHPRVLAPLLDPDLTDQPFFCPGCGIDLHENLSTRLQTVSLNDVRLHCDCGCVLVKVASALRPPLSVPKLPRRRPLRRKAGF